MQISANYVVLKKAKQEQKEGFQVAEVHDDFIYRGEVYKLPGDSVYISNHVLDVGDTVLFAKYSPTTFEMDIDGEKMKFVHISDLLAKI